MLSGLLSVDIILLVTWQVVDPLRRKIETFSLELPLQRKEDVMIKPELEHCSSDHYGLWIGKKEAIPRSHPSRLRLAREPRALTRKSSLQV